MNLFVLLWTQRWCKLCLFIPVRMTLFCKIIQKKKKKKKKSQKRKEERKEGKKNETLCYVLVVPWKIPRELGAGTFFFLFSYDYHHYIPFFFSCVFLFCWLIQDKHCTAPSPLSSVLSTSSSRPPPPHLPSSLSLNLLPLPPLPPSLYLSILFLPSLHLCNTNVLYVVIKQCQTQKLFINNIKQKVSSNG